MIRNKENMRNSYTNKLNFNDKQESVKMTINSQCPDKWLFVDLETGEIWHHNPQGRYTFFTAPKEKLDELKKILKVKQ